MAETPKELTFEEALTEVEKIVADVEQGKIPLEESIARYERGMQLIKHCRAVLDSSEKRIEVINKQVTQTEK